MIYVISYIQMQVMYIHLFKVHRPKKRKWFWVSPFSWVSIIQSLKQNPPKSASKRSRTPCFWTLTSQHGVHHKMAIFMLVNWGGQNESGKQLNRMRRNLQKIFGWVGYQRKPTELDITPYGEMRNPDNSIPPTPSFNIMLSRARAQCVELDGSSLIAVHGEFPWHWIVVKWVIRFTGHKGVLTVGVCCNADPANQCLIWDWNAGVRWLGESMFAACSFQGLHGSLFQLEPFLSRFNGLSLSSKVNPNLIETTGVVTCPMSTSPNQSLFFHLEVSVS